ncbi:MAG: TIGR01906 family membrane protein [Candidatus Promineifilaceae bacterium]
MNKTLAKIMQWLVILTMPLLLGFGSFRLIISDAYPRYAYAKASFPPDFEWTNEQRLALALVAVDYLERAEKAEDVIYLLEEQVKPGTNEPLYNAREIGHMLDVKRVADGLIRPLSWVGLGGVGVGVLALLALDSSRRRLYAGMLWGGALTMAILLGIGLFLIVGWNTFFVAFHDLLFPAGTWTFPLTDSLIRLFPEKFWFDFGVILVTAIFMEGSLVAAVGYWLLSKGKV